MTFTTRDKMVAGAADLMRRRGINATSVREVVRATGTPRGSIGHHFPDGKAQLIEEAVLLAAREVTVPLRRLMEERGAIAAVRAFIALWRQALEESNYEAGCPVLAVAVEQYVGDGKEPGDADARAHARLLDLAHKAFAEWQQIIIGALRREGVPAARARRLAALIVSAVEGATALCRAAHSAAPLDDVRQELEAALSDAIGAGK
jgi:AcrR family transcriptional regulator